MTIGGGRERGGGGGVGGVGGARKKSARGQPSARAKAKVSPARGQHEVKKGS